jgi:hydroxyacylglutathione hydrolase
MQVHRLPVLSDNYVFLLHDPETHTAAVVDPAVAGPVLAKLEALGAVLVALFNTHHHSDHVGGNRQLLQHFPEAVVYAGAEDRGRIPGQQVALRAGDRVTFGRRSAQIFFVPGHTRGHIAYYFPPLTAGEAGDLFCGDTIFAGGCGRLFEGTPAQMVASLGQLRQLPDNTRVWCAHEYTLANLQFAITVEPDNLDLRARFAEVQQARRRDQATVPSLLGLEKQTNPFLRWDQPSLMAAMGQGGGGGDAVRSFAKLRGKKDLF